MVKGNLRKIVAIREPSFRPVPARGLSNCLVAWLKVRSPGRRAARSESNPLNKLVVGNLLHRPLRTLISMFAVAIEIIMILSIVAIMIGMLNGNKTRTSGVGMDMFVRPSGTTMFNGVGGAPAPIKIADILRRQPHVKVVAPVIIQLTSASALENIYGIDFASYDALRPFVFLSGGPFQAPYDVIVDDYFAKADKGHRVGETINIIKHDFRICGIVEHGKGGRKFIPIDTLGQLTGSEGKASVFYLKSDNPANLPLIRSEIESVPGLKGSYEVQTLDEWLSVMTPEHLPAFTAGLDTVIGIAVVIGFLVIFQSMYTAVMERTREIGILKSLGASQGYIINVVLRETALISVVGIVLGIVLTFAIRTGIHLRFPTLDFLITGGWILRGAVIAFIGAMLGAAYPALKAARKDPIDALAYE
jgi:putative ABC transport system permease protein